MILKCIESFNQKFKVGEYYDTGTCEIKNEGMNGKSTTRRTCSPSWICSSLIQKTGKAPAMLPRSKKQTFWSS